MKLLQILALSTVIIIAIASVSLFTVEEYEMALVSEFGKLRVDPKTKKAVVLSSGLHFKTPILEKVRRFDKRLQTLSIQSSRNNTLDKKVLLVDLYVQWKIEDFEKFFTSTSGRWSKVERLLRQKAMDSLLKELGKRTLKNAISDQRGELMVAVERGVDKSARNLGIRVTDVRIKRIDLPEQVSHSVYSRMKSERDSIARQYRASGRSEAEKIRAEADKDARIIVAEAKRKSEAIRGSGDALAIQIYADTYNKSPEFYAYYRSLEAYKNSFNNNDVLLLKPDGEFFKYFLNKNKE